MFGKEIKKLLSTFTEEDFYKNADLHIHSCESDGIMTPYEIIEQAKGCGLKYIAISDHNTLDAYFTTNILKEDIVIPAVEFDCIHKGVLVHILGYGINIDSQELKPLLAKSKFGKTFNLYRLLKLRNPKKVIETIKKAEGIAVLAHPCCCWTFNLDKFVSELKDHGLDGIEVFYPYKKLRKIFKFHSKEKVKKIADKYNLIKTGGTDSHGKNLL